MQAKSRISRGEYNRELNSGAKQQHDTNWVTKTSRQKTQHIVETIENKKGKINQKNKIEIK